MVLNLKFSFYIIFLYYCVLEKVALVITPLRVLKRKKRLRVAWFHFTWELKCTWNGCDFGFLGFTVRSE